MLFRSALNIRQQQLFSATAADRTVLFLNVLIIYFVMAQIINGLFRLAEWRVERRFAGGEAEPLAAELPGGTK